LESGTVLLNWLNEINSEQLTKLIFQISVENGAFGDNIPLLSDFPAAESKTWISSVIHADTGWLIESKETNLKKVAGTTTITERLFTLKE
jgi:hypothetical protein